MQKQTHFFGALASIALLAMTACGHESNAPATGKGGLAPGVQLNTSVESSKATQARSGEEITVADLALTIKSADGTYNETWASVNDYPADKLFPIGNYTVEAAYGDPKDEGFEKPAYFGTADVTVAEGTTTPVSLTATLANAMVSISYTDTYVKYMQSYSATLHSTGGQYLVFTQDETRPAYLNPGKVTLTATFTKPGASAPVSLKVADFDALARHHYHITLDIENGAGDAILKVEFDEMLAEETVTIELSDDLINAPAPKVTGTGVNNGDILNHTFGTEAAGQLKLDIVARGGLDQVILTTHSADLVGLRGWPSELNLLESTPSTQALMQQLGLQTAGLWKNPDKMAVVDFTNVLKNLRENDNNTTTFALQVVDRLGKVSEPFEFKINLEPQTIELSNPATLYIGQGEVEADLVFNGGDPKNVTMEYLNDRGTWTKCATSTGMRARGTETYRIKANVPTQGTSITLRARSAVKASDAITLNREVPPFNVAVDQADVWATKAYVTLKCEYAAPEALLPMGTVYASQDGTTYTALKTTLVNNKLLGEGLTPATKYYLAVSLTGSASQLCPPVEITTESPDNVPNASFEDLQQTLSENQLNQGGLWSISAGVNYQSYVNYTISEPTGWASTNAKTTSGATRNTWFVVPSVFNTTLNIKSTVPKIKIIGTGGGTETPVSYTGFTAHSGSNAMVIRNVQWHPAGTVPGTWLKEFAGKDEYYNHNEPGDGRMAVGKLFLGTYDYNRDADTETLNQGTAFSTRPTALSFFYQYTLCKAEVPENGVATVQVMNGNTVIGQGTAKLAPAVDYQMANVNITYVANAPKATAIRVLFASSDLDENTQTIPYNTSMYRYESARHGSTLVVDNLTLLY